jgi:hypothetical protein
MKIIIITIVLLMCASMSLAQAQMIGSMANNTHQTLASLNLEDVPLKEALRQMFRYVGADFAFDPALDAPPYNKVRITLRVQNANFVDAMNNLLRTNNLAIYPGKGMGIVKPIVQDKNTQSADLSQAMVGNSSPDLVTIDVPAMPVKNALSAVWPESPWKFGGDLGRTPMPGARFYQFPREMAAAGVLMAAGLVPPAGGSRIIAYRGKSNSVTNNQYMPMQSNVGVPIMQQQAGAQQNLYNNQAWNSAYPTQDGIAIAAYQSGNVVLYTVLANRALDSVLIARLMTMSGKSYVMGDPAQSAVRSESNDPVQQQPVPQTANRSKGVTAQLRNVTLDQALSSLLPACGMQFRKIGVPADPTYQIEPMVQTIGGMMPGPLGLSPPTPSHP